MNESDDAGASQGSQRTAASARLDALNAARPESGPAITKAKLEESQSQLPTVVDSPSDIIWSVDPRRRQRPPQIRDSRP
jgi:hypothetical protein